MRQQVFDEIYTHNRWNSKESGSGPGSTKHATAKITVQIRELATELGVESVLNLACGDDNWTPELPGYVGVDVSSVAIHRARKSHPLREYQVLDGVEDPLPYCDLIIIRDCIQHLSLKEGTRLLHNVRSVGAKWLLASTFVNGINEDIKTGDAYSPDLQAHPFNLRNPLRILDDGYHFTHAEDTATRDPRKKLALWSLA